MPWVIICIHRMSLGYCVAKNHPKCVKNIIKMCFSHDLATFAFFGGGESELFHWLDIWSKDSSAVIILSRNYCPSFCHRRRNKLDSNFSMFFQFLIIIVVLACAYAIQAHKSVNDIKNWSKRNVQLFTMPTQSDSSINDNVIFYALKFLNATNWNNSKTIKMIKMTSDFKRMCNLYMTSFVLTRENLMKSNWFAHLHLSCFINLTTRNLRLCRVCEPRIFGLPLFIIS